MKKLLLVVALMLVSSNCYAKDYSISEELKGKLIQYLATQPYAAVYQILPEIVNSKEIVKEEVKKEEVKK